MIARTEELPPGGRTAVAECLVLDIETRPDPRIWNDPDTVEEIQQGIEPDKRLKDPVKIAADVGAKLEKLRNQAALHPTVGRVACIGWQSLDGPGLGKGVWVDPDERTVLQQFANHIGALSKPLLIGGYNVREFDIPFLIHRCAVHQVELPEWFPHRRSWDRIVDPVDLFPRFGSSTLDAHLRAMGLPRKTLTGEESLKLPLPELAEYCANDVEVEAQLIQRLRRSFTMLRRAER